METEKVVDIKVEEIEKDVVSIKSSVPTVIKNDEEKAQAVDLLTKVVARQKRAKEVKDEIVKPLKDHVKAIETKFKDASAPYDEMERVLRRSIADYSLEQERKAQEKERIAREKQEEKNKKAMEQGKAIDLKPVEIERKPTTVEGSAGKVTTKKVWKHEIENVHDLPLKIRKAILDKAVEKGVADTVIRDLVRSGERDIKGVRIYQDMETSVR